ncbi:MAG: GTPase ObgE [Candidatus Eisenbacteria bacterium]|nr:GTPase ObgE [Candidatus Eisenbacteria bacterium]
MLIDSATVEVRGGRGGNGCLSFRREKFVPRGGPNGGDGGDGGSVVLRAAEGRSTLLDFRYRRHYRAGNAQHGGGSNKRGRNGDDVVLEVPVGTLVRDHETGEVLADLDEPGTGVVVARGGRGGRGNARFATSTDRAPRRTEEGEPGEQRTVDLELKLIADAGLVGAPNAGKSTLLSRVSAARPRIADFPFTTLSPVLGLVRVSPGESFVMADLPGLIEGAHEGRGLGLRFLKHTERTSALVILLDVTDEPEETYRTLMAELESYGEGLSDKPRIVALNKIDLVQDGAAPEPAFGGEKVIPVSAVRGDGLDELMGQVYRMIRNSE